MRDFFARGLRGAVGVAIVVSVAHPLFALADSSRSADVHQIKAGSWIACDSEARLGKLISYAVSGDKAAYRKAAIASMQSGECTMFKGGEKVHLVDVKMFGGTAKVRRDGDTDEYWTNTEAVD